MKNHFWKPEFPGNLNAFNRVYTRQTVRNSESIQKVQSVTSIPELNSKFTNMIGNFHASEYLPSNAG
jgi:hypothetical protein